MNGSGASRSPLPPDGLDANDKRILRWLTAAEGANARPVLDAAFAGLAQVRQQRRWPWTGFADSLNRPLAVRLPRWAWMLVALLLAVSLTIAAIAGADRLRPFLDRLLALPAPPALLSGTSCPAEIASSGSVRCLVAAVSARHDRPADRMINLSVTEFSPSEFATEAGEVPILVLDLPDPLGEQTKLDLEAQASAAGRPIIAVAVRGVGAGGSLACPEVEAVARSNTIASLSDPTLRTALDAAVRSCRERLTASGIDLSAFEPRQTVADLESVRLGLGIDHWIVRARGAEAPLALELLRRYPDGIAGIVLVDPVVPTAESDPGSDALAAALHELTLMCAADRFCEGRYRPPIDAYTAILARLADGPVSVAVTDSAGLHVTVDVDVPLVRAAISDALVGSTSLGTLPSLLDRMAGGDFAWPATRLADRGWCLGSELGCSSGSASSGGGDFALWCGNADLTLDPWAVLCPAWLGADRSPPAGVVSNDDVPVLALAARTNPWATVADAEAVLRGLRRGAVVAVPWAPEGVDVTCLGPAQSNWFAAPGDVQLLSCPGIGTPMFGDAP